MQSPKFLIFVGLALGSFTTHGLTGMCHWAPPAVIEAGDEVLTRIDNPWAERCQAMLEFSDGNFLPLTWSFGTIDCPGSRFAEFVVPVGSPNGEAVISW